VIHKNAIIEWRKVAPWRELRYIEQDMIITRALIAIYNDEYLSSKLAFRGGTAIHKLFIKPQVRYSEDIDFVQIDSEPIGLILDNIRDVMTFLGKPRIKQKMNNNTLLYRFEVEEPAGIISRLKIEINCREHFSVYGLELHNFSMINQWFSGDCNILTYNLNELIGTKLRALYQRKKGRDLFDIYMVLKNTLIDVDKVVECYKRNMDFLGYCIPSADEYLENLENKIIDPNFNADIIPFLSQNIDYNVNDAFEVTKKQLIKFL
jgi:predicted nucleotidyltransferase component of viral defense system